MSQKKSPQPKKIKQQEIDLKAINDRTTSDIEQKVSITYYQLPGQHFPSFNFPAACPLFVQNLFLVKGKAADDTRVAIQKGDLALTAQEVMTWQL